MKTQNELNALKKEYEELSNKLHELTDEELEQVAGGLEWKQYDIVMTNMKHFLKDIITHKQELEIIDMATKLDQEEYESWARWYANEHGFDWICITSRHIM